MLDTKRLLVEYLRKYLEVGKNPDPVLKTELESNILKK